VDGEVRFDAGSRAAYSTSASNFRQVPIEVVLSRGGGTSLAGQCTNEAVVIDWSKYCTRLEFLDVEYRTCVVEPGPMAMT
jgi:FAD/FMN-containing dehydrogenase